MFLYMHLSSFVMDWYTNVLEMALDSIGRLLHDLPYALKILTHTPIGEGTYKLGRTHYRPSMHFLSILRHFCQPHRYFSMSEGSLTMSATCKHSDLAQPKYLRLTGMDNE